MDWSLTRLPLDHPTPSIVVSEETVRRNIHGMQQYCSGHGLQLRPHTKTHKSTWMARQQLQAGAVGLTVAKVGEAEVMSDVCNDIFIAYPAIGVHRLQRLTLLAARIRVSVGIDSLDAAIQLQNAASQASVSIGIYVDVEVGFHRTGVVDAQHAVELCKFVASQSHLRLVGLMCFPGHILPNADESRWKDYENSLATIRDAMAELGVTLGTISGGSTPTALESHRNKALTEIRPGTYIYNDWNEVRLGVCSLEDVAARVVATVISTPESHKLVIDAGSKTISSDRNAANPDSGFGYLPDFPNAKVVRLSEEHGEIHLSDEDLATKPAPKVGDRLWLIPNHICVSINLQNEFYVLSDDQMRILRVDARGLLT